VLLITSIEANEHFVYVGSSSADSFLVSGSYDAMIIWIEPILIS